MPRLRRLDTSMACGGDYGTAKLSDPRPDSHGVFTPDPVGFHLSAERAEVGENPILNLRPITQAASMKNQMFPGIEK
jgi:hypothetical protein